ncbi:MAG: glutathione S-transferase family protein [Myxococcales bacterium]|nr:glutathione S-transferase family protein [Myxococcales bacterium]
MADSASHTPRLFMRRLCPYCRRLMVYLDERELAIEIINFDPDQHGEQLDALNPRGTVPTYDTGHGLAFGESFIILQYLEETASDQRLLPTSPADRARMRLLYDLSDAQIGAPMRQFARAPLDDPARERHAALIGKLAHEALALLDERGRFALGGELSIADLSLPPLLYRVLEAGFEPERLPPRVRDWCAALLERPATRAQFPKVEL